MSVIAPCTDIAGAIDGRDVLSGLIAVVCYSTMDLRKSMWTNWTKV
ncbi:MAG TPA: hypothetical protein VMU81_19820 [Acetobacteraceae bacterium]|jgi:hypothetical protein|nr:hypothetical protein [Acetobacteraceae bacterium]